MTPDFIAVHEDWTVKEVLDYVREYGHDSETLNVIYVVDERGKLIDDLRMRKFLLRPLDTRVDEIMDRSFVALTVNDTQEEALNIFRKYDRAALPVVDSNGVLVGIVTRTTCSMSRKKKRPRTSRNSAVWKRWTSPTRRSRFCEWSRNARPG